MANPSTIIDFSVSWADFIATAVSDGTYSDVFVSAKTDGVNAAATDIPVAAGQRWANGVDDFIAATYPHFEGRPVGTAAIQRDPAPTGSPFSFYDIAVPTSDTAVHFKARIYLKDPASAANVWMQTLELMLVNNAGTLTPTVISSTTTSLGAWTVTAPHLVSTTNYALRVQHNAAGAAYLEMHIDVEKLLREAAP